MSTSVRRWLATSSITATLLASATPVRAAEQSEITWTMAPCVTVGPMRPGPMETWQYNLLEGSVAQCNPVVEQGGFRIALYSPDEPTGTAAGYNVRLFSSAAPGEVRDFVVAALPVTEGEYGICVLAGSNERFGCVHVEVSYGETTFVDLVSPLSIDDPLVAKEVVTSPYTGALGPRHPGEAGPRPACGTCF